MSKSVKTLPPFTVVCPVHNEEKMLNRTLRSIYNLHPDEVLFALDRCTDHTAKVIGRAVDIYGHQNTQTIPYTSDDGADWVFRSAYLRRDLYRRSRNDVIVNTSADLNLGPEIPEIIRMIPDPYGLISFGYLDYWTPQAFIRRIHQKIKGGFGGLLALSREAWLDTEDLEDLKHIPQGEDDHLQLAISRKYRTTNVVTGSLHLRPNSSRKDDYMSGVDYWKQRRAPARRMVVRTLIYFAPMTLLGYIHARRVRGDLNRWACEAKRKMKE